MYRRSYMSPYMRLSAALPVVTRNLFLVIAVDRNMGCSVATKVAESNAQEISNLFTMNAWFLRNTSTPVAKKSSLYKIILL